MYEFFSEENDSFSMVKEFIQFLVFDSDNLIIAARQRSLKALSRTLKRSAPHSA